METLTLILHKTMETKSKVVSVMEYKPTPGWVGARDVRRGRSHQGGQSFRKSDIGES